MKSPAPLLAALGLGLALLTSTPAGALDEVTFTAAPDVPFTVQVIEAGAGLASATLAPTTVSAGTLQGRLTELFGAELDYSLDLEAGVLTITGAPHTVQAASRLAPELDRRATQLHFEVTVLEVTRKGSKKKTVEDWLDRGSWSRTMAEEASEAGLIEIVSAPSVTTVVDQVASVRQGACRQMHEADRGEPDPRCPSGSRYAGFELQLLPRMVGDRLLVDITTVRHAWQERTVSSQRVVMEPREAAALALPGDDGTTWVFVTATIVR